MSHWIVALYLVSLVSFLVPTVIAGYFGTRWQAPLAFNFIKLNLAYAVFWSLFFAAFLFLDLLPADGQAIELFFDTLFFLVYGGLLVFVARFLFEMIQKPWEGRQRRVTEALALLGVVLPLAVHALVFDGAERVQVLRFWLNGVYVFLFLGWVLFLFVQSLARLRGIPDPWKKRTLLGAVVIIFAGIPFYLVDIAWPWFQVEWKVIPRGFNMQLFVVLAWNVFFTVRWLSFPIGDSRPGSAEPVSERLDRFTAREREIVLLILKGKSNQEIGEALNVRLGTTKNHIYNIFNKTGASSRRELRAMLVDAPPGF